MRQQIVFFLFIYLFIYLFIFLAFLGPLPWHMEDPRLGVKSELQLLAYTRATVTWELSTSAISIPQLTEMPDP